MHLAKVPGGDRELDSEITGPKVHHSPHSLAVPRETLGLTRMRNHNLGAPPPNIHRLFLHGVRVGLLEKEEAQLPDPALHIPVVLWPCFPPEPLL